MTHVYVAPKKRHETRAYTGFDMYTHQLSDEYRNWYESRKAAAECGLWRSAFITIKNGLAKKSLIFIKTGQGRIWGK